MNPHQLADNVSSKEDFINLVEALRQDLVANPEKWENKTLDDFLEALGRWTEDSDGYYLNMGKPVPQNIQWKVFADILCAASIYE